MRHFKGIALASVLALMLSVGCMSQDMDKSGSMDGKMMSKSSLETAVRGWHPAAQEAAMFMMNKYGSPDGMTGDMLVWNNSGPFKRTIVYREAVDHHFPMKHPDVLEQFVNYEAPEDKFDDIAMYDGSVIIERTKGEMSARCDKEVANLLALNLADEIATGRRTVEDARMKYAEQIKAMKAGQSAPYTERLMFTPPRSGADPDRPVM